MCVARYPRRNAEDITEFLRCVSGFEDESTSRTDLVINFVERHTFPKNHVIYREGDPLDFVYIIKHGEVEVNNPNDRRLEVMRTA